MNEKQIEAKLLEHRPTLNAGGILHLRLFGSKAPGDDTAESDVNLIADFDGAKKLTLFDVAGLAQMLKCPVDLYDRRMLKEEIRARVEREAVLAF